MRKRDEEIQKEGQKIMSSQNKTSRSENFPELNIIDIQQQTYDNIYRE